MDTLPTLTILISGWSTIPEILNRLFRLFLDANDIWSLAACANVCRAWRRSICILAKRFTAPQIQQDRKLIKNLQMLAKKLTRDTAPEFRELPIPPPFQGTDEAAFCNRMLGPLLGRGSFARVYALGGVSPWCIKIATGGYSSTDRFTIQENEGVNQILAKQVHVSALCFNWYSSGTAASLLPLRQIGVVLGGEFQRLQTIASYPLPPARTPLYPIPYLFGVLHLTGYYVMERLFGPTMRAVLKSAVRGDKPGEDFTEIDFHALVVRLVLEVEFLLAKQQCWHGDMKPENIILVREGLLNTMPRSAWRLRLIDPVPQSIRDDEKIITLPYNPAAYLDWRSDFASLILLVFEIQTGARPFTSLGAVSNDALQFPEMNAVLAKLKQCVATIAPAVSVMADQCFTRPTRPGLRYNDVKEERLSGPQCLRLFCGSVLSDKCKNPFYLCYQTS